MLKSLIKCIIIAVVCFVLAVGSIGGYLWYEKEQEKEAAYQAYQVRMAAEAQTKATAAAVEAAAAAALQAEAAKQQAAAAVAAKLVPAELQHEWYQLITYVSPLYNDKVSLACTINATQVLVPGLKPDPITRWEKTGQGFNLYTAGGFRWAFGFRQDGAERRHVVVWKGADPIIDETLFCR